MGFDKFYPNRKDWRSPYTRRGRYDKTCRPHGGCPYCEANRFHSERIRIEKAEDSRNDELQGTPEPRADECAGKHLQDVLEDIQDG